MANIWIIDETYDRPMPPFLEESIRSLGHSCATYFLDQMIRNPSDWWKDEGFPDGILSIQNTGFRMEAFMRSPEFHKIPKTILFFDDPVGTAVHDDLNHPWIQDPEAHSVRFMIWDGYWRRTMERAFGWKSHPIHLAESPKYYSPDGTDKIPSIAHCLVFMGNLPSSRSIMEEWSFLPQQYQQLARATWDAITNSKYGENPYEILEKTIDANGPQFRQKWEDSARDPRQKQDWLRLRRCIWLHAKRMTRIRALRVAAQVAPLAILSHSKKGEHMERDELSKELKGKELYYIDTAQATYYQLRHLYASGKCHFQTTDPQSVEGGIPLRVFQCAACKRPLVSDRKKELLECFQEGKEIKTWEDETALSEAVEVLMHNDSLREEMAESFHQRFLKDHTWEKRIDSILNTFL